MRLPFLFLLHLLRSINAWNHIRFGTNGRIGSFHRHCDHSGSLRNSHNDDNDDNALDALTLPSPITSTPAPSVSHSAYNTNRLWNTTRFKCHFYIARHGRSLANEQGVICSNPAVACHQFGLSATGLLQAAQAGQDAVRLATTTTTTTTTTLTVHVVVVSSDLLRAVETAEAIQSALQEAAAVNRTFTVHDAVVLDVRLRERDFGAWDGASDTNYMTVWQDDALDSAHTVQQTESVDSVMDRVTACVRELDDTYASSSSTTTTMVVLVAHGDVLQILQSACLKQDGRKHRTCVEHLETAQLRPLVLSSTPST